ncbi:MAG: hypothetical protein JWP44_3991 [Mucilaginibacter sp.]|nr:hypothetical protein [Mucilaginibacter sp.]
MKKYTLSFFSIIILITAFYACQKNITVSPPPYTNKVSIQCLIEADSVPVLYLNETVPYFDSAIKKNQLVIRNAQVSISSAAGSDMLILDSLFDKIDCQYNYFYRGKVKILANTTYQLNIVSGIYTFKASAATDMIPPVIDSVTYTAKFNDINGEHEGVIVYFKDNGTQTNFYRYELLRYVNINTKKAESPIVSACLGKDSILTHEIGRAVFNDVGLQGQQIKIVAEPAYSHSKGTKGQIYMQAIDKSAYDFFNQLDQQKIASANPFVEPVFLKPGQFGDQAIGFFSAKKNSAAYAFTYPE